MRATNRLKLLSAAKPLPFSLIGDGGDHVGDEQRRHHHRQMMRQRRAEDAHGQIGRQEDKRKVKAPQVVWKPKTLIGSCTR